MTRDRRCELRAIVVRSEVILSVYIITFLMCLPGNIPALYAFNTIKIHKKPTPTDILLLNLIVSELIFLIFLPLKMHEAAFGMVWTLPSPLCNITSFVFFSFIYTSSLLLMVVNVDRYLCVAFPVQYRLRRKPLYVVVSSLVVWVFSSVNIVENQTSSDFYACYENFTQEQLRVVLPMRLELCVVLYIVPLLACVFCYLKFILILNRTPNLCAEKRKRAVGMAIGTILVFVVCFLPYNVTHVQGFVIQDNVEWRLYALLLTTVNTVLDPMTFYFSSSMFQATMKRILTGKRMNSSPGVFMTAQNNTRDIEGQSNPPTTEGALSDH
ncbi:free fatty acid receptor 2-like [Salvelinus fontinalis]|uniref:free fatty acid receptor 2-like n=1 Tax=Salvelinus fontinalis TaxID=8038 RepID=UPI002486369A|nr:free fatty acid receptor 2-like [Salvelinus fontinalis]